jgi:hypothetical protein
VQTRSNHWIARLALLVMFALGYFVVYPQDFAAVLAPVKELLALSNSVSPWLYGVVAVAILAWTLAGVWGRRLPRTSS